MYRHTVWYIILYLLLYIPLLNTQLPPAVAIVGVLPSYDITTRAGINEPPSPPAAEYLGTGYDIVKGNPAETETGASIDPGFRQGIIQLIYDIRDASGGYQQPYGTYLKMIPSCSQGIVASEITTIQEYQAFLAADVMIQNFAFPVINNPNITTLFVNGLFNAQALLAPANMIPSAFAASLSLQAFKQSLAESDSISFYSRSLCYEYQVEFRSYIQPQLIDNFINGVATLPDTYPLDTDTSVNAAISRAKFLAFIAEFGTHYTHRIVVGGKRIVSVSMQTSTVQQLKQFDINVAALLNTLNIFNGATSLNNNTNNIAIAAEAIELESIFASVMQRRESTVGGSPFLTFEEWARSIPGSNRAVPLQYTLKPIYLLLAGAKQIALRQAIQAYIDTATTVHLGT